MPVLSPDRVCAIREAEFACTEGRWGSVFHFYLTHYSCKTDFWGRFPTRRDASNLVSCKNGYCLMMPIAGFELLKNSVLFMFP
jgi:hypothetical protein